MSKIYRSAILLFFAASTYGCAFGNKITYTGSHDINVPIPARPIALVVADDRPYVRSGNKSPQWVGLLRSGFGIPYGVHTASGRPLAQDVAELVGQSLRRKKIDVKERFIVAGDLEKEIPLIAKAEAGRAVAVVKLTEWKTDTYFSPWVYYDVALISYDESGNVLARTSVAKTEKLDDENPKRASANVAITDIIANLFSDPVIVAALNKPVAAPVARAMLDSSNGTAEVATSRAQLKEKCSTAQVLEMKNAGLTDLQVRAACEPPKR